VTRLTSLASGAGCGCKLPAGELMGLLAGLSPATDGRLLVGSASSDDAAVFLLDERTALVQTVDFFTPPVDDPYEFGRIAAANALSDVYAMGGRPLTALNIVAFPLAQLGGAVLAEILRGGQDVVAAAGAVLAGGHSIDDPEPKYGLAVTGVVDPDAIVTNAGGVAGDALVLTKPLGTGAVVTASIRADVPHAALDEAVATMVTLNASASAAAVAAGAHAMTDVTGFGLLGHLHHLCRESGLAAVLDAGAVPHLAAAQELLADRSGVSGGSRRNGEWAQAFVSFADGVEEWRRRLLVDATTSGGLLVAVAPERAERVPGAVIGQLIGGAVGTIHVG
jgi:selenide,water dikinase